MSSKKLSEMPGRPELIAAYLAICTALLLILIYQVWRGCFIPEGLTASQLFNYKMVAYALCFGGLGGTTYSLFGLFKHTAEKNFDPRFFYWYLFRGVLGAVLGMIVVFLVNGGLLVLSDNPIQNAFQSKSLIVGVAFLAGFSANQFVRKLQDLSRTIWAEKK